MADTVTSFQIGDDQVRAVTLGPAGGLSLMAGPCVIESLDLCRTIAARLVELTDRLGLGFVFKASFDKANRTSLESFRGPGLQRGLDILDQIRREFAVPVLTDIHLPEQAALCAPVVDMIQIPAFLARQTDLLVAAAQTGKPVQIKKAQFMAPWDLKPAIAKVEAQGNRRIALVERGSSFGYNRLVCDMTALGEMQQLGYPAIMDATHATQQPSGLGNASGGSPALAQTLARAAVAAGADGLFIETHPEPARGLSDAATMIRLDDMEPLLSCCHDLYERVRRP